MAKAEQIKALIRCHSERDDARFYAVAAQVAAQEARAGRENLAQELLSLIDEGKTKPQPAAVPLVQPRGELAGLLSATYPKTRLSDMILSDKLHQKLNRVVHEQRQRAHLMAHGFSPQRKLLLVGPPGTGKTMSAAALAGELGLPLFTVQLDGLMSKYMGETAAKLRLVFDAMARTRGVYFFDEFDALGSHRSSTNDVGEIRRVLNSFLQFLEGDASDSLILGATNLLDLLDQALFRRFDAVLHYELPTPQIVEQIIEARLALLDTSRLDWPELSKAAQGLSHGEITRACEQAGKDALLSTRTTLTTQDLLAALEDRRAMQRHMTG